MDLKNNPWYQAGVFKGARVAQFIENTVYGSLEAAIESKEQLVEDLKTRLGYDDNHKDVAETLGIIDALKQEQAKRKAEEPENILTPDDVSNVAFSIGMTVDEEKVQEILRRYPAAQESDPSATWDLVIEQLIHEVNNENL